QAPGKELMWLATIKSDSGRKSYSGVSQGRFTLPRINGQNTVTLQMINLKAEDTATYYCAK
ncbi:Ig heavy chain V region C3, partial [Anas platyrhynchos]